VFLSLGNVQLISPTNNCFLNVLKQTYPLSSNVKLIMSLKAFFPIADL
jgi:hypothetical protein